MNILERIEMYVAEATSSWSVRQQLKKTQTALVGAQAEANEAWAAVAARARTIAKLEQRIAFLEQQRDKGAL